MSETTVNSKPASVDPNTLRLPWGLRVASILGIAVPIGMLAHLGHEDREELGQTVEDLGQSVDVLSEQNVVLTIERDALAPLPAEIAELNTELVESGQLLATSNQLLVEERTLLARERTKTVGLESEIITLNGRVAVMGEREEALRGIIDLLEGEVASAEGKLAKLSEQRPSVAPEFSHLTAAAIVASNDPQLRRENERLRNELRKHDEQVVELLGEISALNQELEVVQGERSRIGNNGGLPASNLSGAALAGLSDDE